MNLIAIKDLAHELESLLDAARQHKLAIDSAIIDVILEGGDTLKKFVGAISAQLGGTNAGSEILIPTLGLIGRVKAILADPSAPRAVAPAPVAAPESVAAPTLTFAEPVETPKPVDPPKTPEPAKAAVPANSSAQAGPAGSVKVDTRKLDSLIDLVGELVISQTMVIQNPRVSSLQSQTLTRNLAQLRRITNELQRTTMSLRMVPIRATFQKMTRLVRDLAAKQGKQMQLVRNGEEQHRRGTRGAACPHDPQRRRPRLRAARGARRAGKSAGRHDPSARLSQRRKYRHSNPGRREWTEQGQAARESSRARRGERGRGACGQGNLQLIFAPGFSTAEAIIDISGRGLGMDVVRRNIEKANHERPLDDGITAALASVDKPLEDYIRSAEGIIALAAKDRAAAEAQWPAFSETFSQLEVAMGRTGDTVEASVKNVSTASNALVTQFRITVVTTLVLAVVSFSLLSWFITRGIVTGLDRIGRQLDLGARQLTESSREVSHSSQTLAESASEQAASLEETSASLEEISAMTKRNGESASNGKNLGREARDSASSGMERLGELTRTLNSIESATGEMQTAVQEMQTSSQEIAKIIKTIDEIAFQTNLLALNAAVEAARAGEAGMGFAVVADEVRALAQRSAQAAKDTSEKIESAVKRSELGGAASAKVVRSLTEVEATAQTIQQVFTGIVGQIKSLDEVISQIAAASQEQTQGIGEVNMAVSQMDKVTQSNAASAEENASAATVLNSQAARCSSPFTTCTRSSPAMPRARPAHLPMSPAHRCLAVTMVSPRSANEQNRRGQNPRHPGNSKPS